MAKVYTEYQQTSVQQGINNFFFNKSILKILKNL